MTPPCPKCGCPTYVQSAYLCGTANDWIAYECSHCPDTRKLHFPNRTPAFDFYGTEPVEPQKLLGPAAQARSPVKRNEVHLVQAPNGHIMSVDCWCEPVSIQWITNKHGVKVLVVDHTDDTLLHHTLILTKRTELRGTPASGNMADVPINKTHEAPWITRVLNDVKGTS